MSEEPKQEAKTEEPAAEAKETEEATKAEEVAPEAKTEEKKEEKNEEEEKQEDEDSEEEEKPPEFEYAKGHKFAENEKVYVIDPNKFDIWEGEVEKVVEDGYAIHYPDYPDDDETIKGDDIEARILQRSEKNVKIYEDQEKAREENRLEEEKRKKRRQRRRRRQGK